MSRFDQSVVFEKASVPNRKPKVLILDSNNEAVLNLKFRISHGFIYSFGFKTILCV